MKRHSIPLVLRRMTLLAAAITLLHGLPSRAATINLKTAGTSGFAAPVVGGPDSAWFFQGEIQPSGSGNINSFLRIQANGSEMGFNVPQEVKAPLDAKDGSFTRTLALSDVPTRVVNGVVYREFLLDLNENIAGNETNPDRYISLNQVQIFLSSAPLNPIPGYTFVDNVAPSGPDLPPVIVFNNTVSGAPTMNEIFRLNNSGTGFTEVQMNAELSSGSGASDMTMLIADSLFVASKGTFVTLFSQFGHEPGLYPSEATYEEWAVRGGTAVVPEPSTFALGLGALGLLGLASLRRRQLS